MAVFFYFIVILVTAASVMFGLDLVTSPLRPAPNVPIGNITALAPTRPEQMRENNHARDKAKHLANDQRHELNPTLSHATAAL